VGKCFPNGCTTGVERKRAEEIASYADLAWGCASYYIRKTAGRKAKLQLGVRIPVFVFTERGISFVDAYSCKELKKYVCGGKRYLVTLRPKGGGMYRKIRMGDFDAYFMEAERSPVESNDMSRPLL